MDPFETHAVPADWCLHASNVCYLASYLTRDMLWLRGLTCVGLGMGIVFFTCGSQPMFGPTAWQATFLGINLLQIARLLRHREKVRLSEEEAALGALAFEHLTREELADLLARGGRVGTLAGERSADPAALSAGDLTEDERVLRDVAYSGLSRADLLNLVTRRFHGSVYHLTPGRVRTWTRRLTRRRRTRRAARRDERRAELRRKADRAASRAGRQRRRT